MFVMRLKNILVLAVLIIAALILIRIAVRVFLPIAIVVIAGYIIYMFVTGRKRY